MNDDQIKRYSRHILMPEIGVGGQQALLDAKVFVIGAGGLGSPVLMYLAAAGVGTLGVADDDCVELHNLQRQVLYGSTDLGRNKTAAAAERIRTLNPDCRVGTVAERITAQNIGDVIGGYDLVVDGSDNFATKFMVADTCWRQGIRLVSAGVVRFQGQVMTLDPRDGNPCYRCLMPEPPDQTGATCAEVGVLGAVVGVIGSLQAAEAVKVLTGAGRTLATSLVTVDALTNRFNVMQRRRNPACPLCGDKIK